MLKMWGRERFKVEKVCQKRSFLAILAKFGRKHPQTKQLPSKPNKA